MSTVSVLNTDAQLNAKTLALIGSANSGNLLFTDATYDIGQSGATRPRDLFLSRNAVVGGTLGVTGVASFTAAPTVAAGIQFPATQVPSADPNNLDDYEEGSWTPVIGGSGGTSGQTYTTQAGRYIKFGKLVHIQCQVVLSAKGTITTDVQIQGLPFTALNAAGAFGAFNVQWFAAATNFVYISAEPQPNTTAATLYGLAAAGATLVALATANIAATTQFIVTGTYIADA